MNTYELNKAKYGTHSTISEEIGTDKVILDIGCNKGYLRDLVPNNVFYGIDYDAKALEVAKANYEKVYEIDLNNNYTDFEEGIRFDVIVLADILEHLVYPEIVSKYFINNYLENDGIVIVSLPNVAHLSVRLKLLLGKFGCTKGGILDTTHLHFYTLDTGKKLLNDVELTIEKIKFSSNNFGFLTRRLPFLGSILGYNMVFVCKKY